MKEKDHIIQHLSSKVAISITKKGGLPFAKREFPKLSDNCIQVLAKHFDKYPTLDGLERHHKEKVYDSLDLEFSIENLAKHVDYDPFWKKSCEKKWNLKTLAKGFHTWKSAFFSRYLQEYLQELDNYEENEDKINNLIKVMAPALEVLSIEKVKIDFNMCDVLRNLNNLKTLRLTWVKKDSKGPFSTSQLGMNALDATNTANLIMSLRELDTVELVCNKLDDDALKILERSLEDHPTVRHISLGHNKLSNVGARRAARIFGKNRRVLTMDLSNNQIGYEGARCLSMVLSEPTCQLRHLDISLNLVSDKALCVMLADITQNSQLESLNVSANLLTDECVPHIIQFLSSNTALRSFKANCNKFSSSVYDDLKRCLLQNKYLEVFEVFNNDIGSQKEMELAEIILKKSAERRGNTFVTVTNLEKYLEDQKKAKEPKEEEKLRDATAKPAEIEKKLGEADALPKEDHKEGDEEDHPKEA